MSLVEHAEQELRANGMYDEDPEWAESIVAAVRGFASYGHSGSSAAVGIHALHDLLQFKPLGPLTANPDEWMHVDEDAAGNATTWQSRRRPDAFSSDGGKTYYLLDERQGRFRRWFLRRPRMHRAVEATA